MDQTQLCNIMIWMCFLLLQLFFFCFCLLQVSLRDPMRLGEGDDKLREIIGAAVCSS